MSWRHKSSSRSLPEVHGSVPSRPQASAQAVRLCGSRLPRGGRLHGPGQLGHRSRRRRALRLHAAQRDHAVEPDGDPAAGALGAPRHRQRPGPRAGLPRPLLAAVRRSCCGCSARSRSPPAIWPKSSAPPIALNLLFGLPLIVGRVPDRARRADRAVPAAAAASATSRRSWSR